MLLHLSTSVRFITVNFLRFFPDFFKCHPSLSIECGFRLSLRSCCTLRSFSGRRKSWTYGESALILTFVYSCLHFVTGIFNSDSSATTFSNSKLRSQNLASLIFGALVQLFNELLRFLSKMAVSKPTFLLSMPLNFL